MADRNTIANIDALIRIRLQGQRPALQTIWFGGGGRLHGCEVGINANSNLERLDLRVFVDLDLMVIAEHYSPALMRLCERLNEYAATTTLSVIAWLPDDLGLVWTKGSPNAREFGPGPVRQEVAA